MGKMTVTRYEAWDPATEKWHFVSSKTLGSRRAALTLVHRKHVNGVLFDILQDGAGHWYRAPSGQ